MNDDHGRGYVKPDGEEPDLAARAKTLLAQARQGALATNSLRHPGWPFTSVMPYAMDGAAPLFLISRMAIHTQNLTRDDRASLLVTLSGGEYDPLSAERVTLIGRVNATTATTEMRERYLARHPEAARWVDFADFSFYRFHTEDVYYVGGFGIMGWVDSEDYVLAEADPLAEHAEGIIEHMNHDHADALRLIARRFASIDASNVVMTSCDRAGFTIRAEGADGSRPARIEFPEKADSPADARRVLVAMTKEARATITS
jgi:putative heme iron utilization protein